MSKPFNEEIHGALVAYMTEYALSQPDAGRELGVSASAVNKYVNQKPEGDVSALESAIMDVVKNAPMRRRTQLALFDTPVALELAACLEQVRKTSDIAVLTGEAGLGKTCGAMLYASRHPTALFMTATRYCCNARTQRRLLWEQVNTTGWRSKEKVDDPPPSQDRYLVKKFMGSQRLAIIDGCHRLTGSGIEWWFDFADATGLSLAFIGNPCFVDKLKRLPDEDQHLSRVGMSHEVRLSAKDAPSFARQILGQIAPEHAAGLLAAACKVVMGPGHGRALRKQVTLALDLLEGLEGDMGLAFQGAGQRLLNRDGAGNAEGRMQKLLKGNQ